MKASFKTAIAVLCLAGSGVIAGDERIHDEDALHAALAAPATVAIAQRISLATEARDAGALVGNLEAAAALPEPARTVMTFHALLALAAAAPDSAATTVLERHAREGASVRVWHDDEGRRVAVDAYDTAAAARFTLRVWRRVVARDEAVIAIRDGTLMREKSTWMDSAAVAGYADALRATTDDDLYKIRPQVANALRAGEPVEALALVLVERLHDVDLAASLLAHATVEFVVRSIGTIVGVFAPDVAFDLLAEGAGRPDIASVVVFRIGETARTLPAARAWLHARLGTPLHGASAAAALARIADSDVVATLEGQLRDAPDPRVQSRAALALHLSDRDDARAVLEAFVASEEGPDALRRVVAQWLR